MQQTLRAAISVGEFSADEHGAELVKSLRKLVPEIQLRGMGGSKLRAAGVETLVDSEKSGALMGFGAVLGSLGSVLKSLDTMRQLLKSWRPELLILIDYPDFNLRLARTAQELGIKVFYFIPPKVWAWRSSRIQTISKLVNKVGLIFPFERAFFEKHGYTKSLYVGHPFSDTFGQSILDPNLKAQARNSLKLAQNSPLLAIFPGSRWNEVRSHCLSMLQTYEILRTKIPGLTAILALASSIPAEKFYSEFPHVRSTVHCSSQSLKILQAADVGLLKSGTSNLQAAFCGLPFVMFHRTSLFAELVVRTLVNLKEYSPVNVIRPGSIRELTQRQANPQYCAQVLEPLFYCSSQRKTAEENLREVAQRLGAFDQDKIFDNCTSAYERAARLGLSCLE